MAEEAQPIENKENVTVDNNPQPAAPTHSAGPGGLAIAALIVGIVAVLSGWAIFFGLIAGAVAIVLAVLALKKKQHKGMSIAGLVTGIVAAVWNLVVIVLWAFWMVALVGIGAAAGQAANGIQETVNNMQEESENKINAKKEFSKGEVADFGDFKIQINSVNTNYTPDNSWSEPDSGKKFISVNVTITNDSDETPYISGSSFDVSDGSLIVSNAWVDGEKPLDSGSLAPGGSITGDIVYEVSDSSTSWKLQYKEMVMDYKAGSMETITYKLEF